jgi:hypothetical protein
VAVHAVTPNDRAKAAAARDHACDLLIHAFNRLERLDAQSAGDIVDAIIAAVQAAPPALSEHAAAVHLELGRVEQVRPWTCLRCGLPTAVCGVGICNCDEPILPKPSDVTKSPGSVE